MKKAQNRPFRSPGMSFALSRWLAPACAIVISGCSVSLLPEKTPQRIFDLPYTAPEPAGRKTEQIPPLQVNRPHASGVHDSNRVVIELESDELAAYSGTRWVADAPLLLREHLVRSLRQDPRMGNVVSDESGAVTTLTLTSSLREFQEDRTGNSKVIRIYLQAQLVENGSREILATRDFQVSHEPAGESLDHSIDAFGDAATSLATELADWIVASAPARP
ncbi:cholesterol transport system auxiliary component [Marinobacter daqiaonensis]|uniref:Cholesterol transport system auxiliary component n=1 Tax=Marinobacter daqiaonensis TaxID=650891 RepID=A0A1I6GND5_9GAMM|nr:ABC-type transport auxiliary lipoprotein family protein [Marinobacter daqiaonensis]SFR43735.1 cholesterol transport system auxiliary component [Marinobacter daqiaonensis]